MSVKARSSGRPPTLWCSLMVAAGPSGEPPLSITSGYKRALGEELGPFDPGGLVGKTLDEGVPDPPPFLLRIGHAGQGRQESVLGLDHVQVGLGSGR